MQQLFTSRGRLFIVAAIAALALVVSVGAASASAGGGNSANAKQCQKDGWKKLIRTDGSSFTNEETCVSYAAKGGTLKPKTQAQIDCETYGGTFSTDPAADLSGLGGGALIWVCNGTDRGEVFVYLMVDCFDIDGGGHFGSDNTGNGNLACHRF